MGTAARGPGGFPFAPCPTSRAPTLQAAFAHLALAFRCDVFTLRQRVQVETQARDAAEENIQEELGQCRAALEVGGHQGMGHLPGTSSPGGVRTTPSPGSGSSILSLRRGWAHPAPTRAARRRWSSCGVVWLCWRLPSSGQPARRRSWGLSIRSVYGLGLPARAGSDGGCCGWARGPVPGLAGVSPSSWWCWR